MWANAQRDGRPDEYRCSTPQSLDDAHYQSAAYSNAVKTRKPLKFVRVPQTRQQISAARGPKFTTLWGHWSRYCCLTSFFPDCRYVP